MGAIEEYEAMRTAIQSNIEAIRSLLTEAKSLNDLVDNISDNTELKEQLEQHLQSLHKSIDNLVEQTNALFEQYIKLANSVVTVS
jgi:chromosome segregation ATPase